MNVDLRRMRRVSEEASVLLKALAAPRRLLMLCQLTEGERSVGELADAIGAEDAAVSQHLAVLRREGLVRTRREGQTIYYALDSEPARAVLGALYETLCAVPPRRGKAAR
jgi:DNA-binding transcriptional ArsR family regulator